MVKRPKTLTADSTGAEAVRMLEHEFVRQMMEVYRADHPQSKEPDATLYERMRAKFRVAFQRLEFDQLDNLAPARALDLLLRGNAARAGALLEEHHAQQGLVAQGEIHNKRSKAGNDAQAMGELAKLPDGHPLKAAVDIPERNRLICEHAQGLKRKNPNLKAAVIKRKVGEWAQMSPKQVGRILESLK